MDEKNKKMLGIFEVLHNSFVSKEDILKRNVEIDRYINQRVLVQLKNDKKRIELFFRLFFLRIDEYRNLDKKLKRRIDKYTFRQYSLFIAYIVKETNAIIDKCPTSFVFINSINIFRTVNMKESLDLNEEYINIIKKYDILAFSIKEISGIETIDINTLAKIALAEKNESDYNFADFNCMIKNIMKRNSNLHETIYIEDTISTLDRTKLESKEYKVYKFADFKLRYLYSLLELNCEEELKRIKKVISEKFDINSNHNILKVIEASLIYNSSGFIKSILKDISSKDACDINNLIQKSTRGFIRFRTTINKTKNSKGCYLAIDSRKFIFQNPDLLIFNYLNKCEEAILKKAAFEIIKEHKTDDLYIDIRRREIKAFEDFSEHIIKGKLNEATLHYLPDLAKSISNLVPIEIFSS